MTQPFLEELLPVDVRMGASYGDDYRVDITTTAGGREYRRLLHPWPQRRFRVAYTGRNDALWSQILALYHRAYGMFAGFRVRAIDDWSTNGMTDVPTAADQLLATVSTGVYQLQKAYGAGSTPLDIGLPVRTIFKPVAGSVLVAIRNAVTGDHAISGSVVDTTTGQVTLPANKTKAITGITQAAAAVITVGSGHGFVVGDSVYISGVAGMTQINGRRAAVTAAGASTITVAINSAAFSAYTSGGTLNTRPQTGEDVRGGCRFDIPCRFASAIDINSLSRDVRGTDEIEIVELIAL